MCTGSTLSLHTGFLYSCVHRIGASSSGMYPDRRLYSLEPEPENHLAGVIEKLSLGRGLCYKLRSWPLPASM